MKAKLVETESYIYYGEVSLEHPMLPHGKGIRLNLEKNFLDEGWFEGGIRSHIGRWIDNYHN